MIKSSQKISQEIDVTPEAAWEIIGAVTGVDKWLGPITSCRLEGDQRICGTEEGEFKEDILKVDHDNMVLEYLIPQQHMMPVENIRGNMSVTANNAGHAVINWSWEFDVLPENESAAKEGLQQVGGMGITGIESLIKQKQVA